MEKLAKKKILAIDDDLDILNQISKCLSDLYDVVITPNAAKAIEELPMLAPSLIILDIYMPGMGGLEALAKIRASGNMAPVIVLTAMEDDSNATKAMQLGASEYITKPFKPELLAEIVLARVPIAGQKRQDKPWKVRE